MGNLMRVRFRLEAERNYTAAEEMATMIEAGRSPASFVLDRLARADATLLATKEAPKQRPRNVTRLRFESADDRDVLAAEAIGCDRAKRLGGLYVPTPPAWGIVADLAHGPSAAGAPRAALHIRFLMEDDRDYLVAEVLMAPSTDQEARKSPLPPELLRAANSAVLAAGLLPSPEPLVRTILESSRERSGGPFQLWVAAYILAGFSTISDALRIEARALLAQHLPARWAHDALAVLNAAEPMPGPAWPFLDSGMVSTEPSATPTSRS